MGMILSKSETQQYEYYNQLLNLTKPLSRELIVIY